MALIDRTYFNGEILIPSISTPSVGQQVDWLIEEKQEEFLTNVLGYPLYKAFMSGLNETIVSQKWLDLLYGVEYTNNSGYLKRWNGLVNNPTGNLVDVIASLNPVPPLVVGRGNMYDPIPNTNILTIPPALVGKDFSFVQRGIGELIKNTEYSVTGNRLTLLNGIKFSSADVYFYKSAALTINATTGIVKTSVIAYYVYFYWMKNNNTQTTTGGEVRSKHENTELANPRTKMISAWNKMSKILFELADFMYSKSEVYTEWNAITAYTIYSDYKQLTSFS